MRLKTAGLAATLLLALLPSTPVVAVWGGESALGSDLVLSWEGAQDARDSACTGSLISDQIVLTASHCIAKENGASGTLRFDIDDIWVSQPGVDIKVDDISTRVKVLKVWFMPGYVNAGQTSITGYDDIAFFFLEKPLRTGYTMPIATSEEVARIKAGLPIIHYGYGLQNRTTADGKPYTVELTGRPYATADTSHANKVIQSFGKGDKGLCPGDSGGPLYARIDGVLKIVAAQSAGSGCGGEGAVTAKGTLVFPYVDWLRTATEDFTMDEEVLRKNWKARLEASAATKVLIDKWQSDAKATGHFFEDTSCHGRGAQATLQKKVNGAWQDVVPAAGWNPGANCPVNTPLRPYAVTDIASGTTTRWKVYIPGAWEWFGQEQTAGVATGSAQAKPAAVVAAQDALPSVKYRAEQAAKAQAEAEAKAKAEAEANAKASAAAGGKRQTITCVKGKVVRKVTAIKPKCPSGFARR